MILFWKPPHKRKAELILSKIPSLIPSSSLKKEYEGIPIISLVREQDLSAEEKISLAALTKACPSTYIGLEEQGGYSHFIDERSYRIPLSPALTKDRIKSCYMRAPSIITNGPLPDQKAIQDLIKKKSVGVWEKGEGLFYIQPSGKDLDYSFVDCAAQCMPLILPEGLWPYEPMNEVMEYADGAHYYILLQAFAKLQTCSLKSMGALVEREKGDALAFKLASLYKK